MIFTLTQFTLYDTVLMTTFTSQIVLLYVTFLCIRIRKKKDCYGLSYSLMEVTKLSDEKKNNLYVLRYKTSGNYYVGTAEDLQNRMTDHWRKTSKKKVPGWSRENGSKEGFMFYWFHIEENGVSRSHVDLCENHLAKLITRKIKYINQKKYIREVHVVNNKFFNGSDIGYNKNKSDISNYIKEKSGITIDDLDKEIYIYLTNLKSLKSPKIQKRLSIKCVKCGYVSKYHLYDNWNEAVVYLNFSNESTEE